MSPFLSAGGKTYKARVYDRAGNRHVRSLGTRNRKDAVLIEGFLARCRDRRDWRTLDAIIAGMIRADEAYYSSLDGSLDAELSARSYSAAVEAEPDCDALVTEWATVARSPKYVRQVRAMIPEGIRFPVSSFTRAAVSRFLASLDCAEPTRNRYRVALSQFARWLVERDYLPMNPVRDVRGYRENDPRMIHYTREEAQSVLRRIDHDDERAVLALMCGAGLEFGAVINLRRRDINEQTREIAARGSKTRWRTRTVRVTEAWCWDYVARYIRHSTPDAALFPGITERKLLERHKAACRAAGVPISTLHDWRHTYAVQALRDGLPPQTVKRQLGHSPHSTMLERVYGAWIPKTDADYVATNLVTSIEKRPARGGAK